MVEVECPHCRTQFTATPRPREWSGTLRTLIRCPNCQQNFRWRFLPNGVPVNQQPVPIHTSGHGAVVFIDEYDCQFDHALEFAGAWKSSWGRISKAAREKLDLYWVPQYGEPHVWLLSSRSDWGGNGLAATIQHGKSFCFLSSVVVALSKCHLKAMIAHELAHAICVAVGEENHGKKNADPDQRIKQEYIVWRLIESWGFDQRDLDAWMENEFEDDEQGVRRRSVSLGRDPSQTKAHRKREEYEARLRGFHLPEVVMPFL